jgi:hypothetical protein
MDLSEIELKNLGCFIFIVRAIQESSMIEALDHQCGPVSKEAASLDNVLLLRF